ncbi:TonB-dependent receptor domain-containing protein, partial [Escherichia coli]|uniref:TonB-dependent receptor domain-containing protein n=1 Tax=Escherichia coli TaxID=562 RepID=UPI0010CAF747
RIGDGLLSLALFQTDTDDEIVFDSSSGGRTTYKNAGKHRRQGAERARDQSFPGHFPGKASWTLSVETHPRTVLPEKGGEGGKKIRGRREEGRGGGGGGGG